MSSKSITQKSPGTEQLVSLPLGNYEQINEYKELIESFITVSTEDFVTTMKKEVEPIVTILDLRNMISTVRNFLKERLKSVGFETHGFYKIVEVQREPKFVIDILIVIPKFNRDKKFTVLSAIGNLMRRYPNLLFDFRIIKEEEAPEGYFAI